MKRESAAVLRALWPAPLAAGALLSLSFAPLDLGFLAVPAWALLFLSMRLRRGDRAGRQAFVAGLVLFVPSLSWIAPLVVAGWLFTAFWCACWEALFAWLVARFWLRRGRVSWIVWAPLLHLLVDMGRTVFMTGFPWLITGYTGWENPVLLGSADLLGVHGATLAILLLAAGLAEVIARRIEGARWGWRPLAPALTVWALLGGWAALKPPAEVTVGPTVALLQANIPQYLKEDRQASGTEPTLADEWWRRHADLALAARDAARKEGRRLDVVVWPETMVPSYARRDLARNGALWEQLRTISGGAQTLAGVVTIDSFKRQWNTVVLLDPAGRPVAGQDKQHLTPGGEYIPLFEWMPGRDWVQRTLTEKAGFFPDLQAGEGVELLPVVGPGGPSRAGVLICYESIFPSLSRDMVRAGADFLVNASNYGWFAGTAEMEQALAMGCFRAAELRRSLVMASNNGISVVIGPDGRPREFAEDEHGARADVAAYLLAEVPLASGTTPFAFWGEWAAWILGLIGLAAGAVGRVVGRTPDPSPTGHRG